MHTKRLMVLCCLHQFRHTTLSLKDKRSGRVEERRRRRKKNIFLRCGLSNHLRTAKMYHVLHKPNRSGTKTKATQTARDMRRYSVCVHFFVCRNMHTRIHANTMTFTIFSHVLMTLHLRRRKRKKNKQKTLVFLIMVNDKFSFFGMVRHQTNSKSSAIVL